MERRDRGERPSVWTRWRILTGGEVPTDDLQAYRHAGLEVWALVESVSERRKSGEVAPVENLGAWIVFTFQTLGNALMDADAHADPATANYVPPSTHESVLHLYREVGPWLARANEARANPAKRLRRKNPVGLPHLPWSLRSNAVGISALIGLVRALQDELPHLSPGLDSRSAIGGRIEAALATARYAEGLVPAGGQLTDNDLSRLERPLRRAACELFRAGQFAAMPSLCAPPKAKIEC